MPGVLVASSGSKISAGKKRSRSWTQVNRDDLSLEPGELDAEAARAFDNSAFAALETRDASNEYVPAVPVPPAPPSTPQPGAGILRVNADPAKQAKMLNVQLLTREYWDTRRQITMSVFRCKEIEKRLRQLSAEDEILHLRGPELAQHLERMERELVEERARSRRVENILKDVQRECTTPQVVPMLLDAIG